MANEATERAIGSNPYAAGGGGTVLEHRYAAALLTHLLTVSPAVELGDHVTVERVRFQARGHSAVDDVLVTGRGADHEVRLASVAARRAPKLVASDPESVDLIGTFVCVMTEHWRHVQAGSWRLALAATATNPVRELAKLAAIARTNPTNAAFRAAVGRPRFTTHMVRNRLASLDKVVAKAATKIGVDPAPPPDELTWRLLSSLTVRELRLEPPDESERTALVAALRPVTASGTTAAAAQLLDALDLLAGGYVPAGADVTESMLRRDLAGVAELARSSRHGGAWQVLDGLAGRLRRRTGDQLADGATTLKLDRSTAAAELRTALAHAGDAATTAPALVISGEPDVGKSALTLRAAHNAHADGAAVLAVSLRDLPPTTTDTEHYLGAPLADVLAGLPVAAVRLLVIDGAEAALEGRHELLADVATAALQSGLGVAAVTRTDGQRMVSECLHRAVTAALPTGRAPARHTVDGLTAEEVSETVQAFPSLAHLAQEPRDAWLLARPGLVDLLLRGDVAPALPDRPLSEADVFAAVWWRLVRRGGVTVGGATPDEREQALVSLARSLLAGAPSLPASPKALASLRSDGLLLPAGGATAAWNPGEEFASDLVRDFATALLLRAEGYEALHAAGAPRWAVRAARLACQAALAAAGDNVEDVRRAEQAEFDRLAAAHGERWAELPLEAALTLGTASEALTAAWPALAAEKMSGFVALVRVGLQRYSEHGLGRPGALAPLVRLIYDHTDELQQTYHRDLDDQISHVILAWLRGLVVEDAGRDLLRARVRDILLEVPEGRSEFLVEALALLGHDLDARAENRLREIAGAYPSFVGPAVESPVAAKSLAGHDPQLLADITEAYYIELPDPDDPWQSYDSLDDGVRYHEAGGWNDPMAAWYRGPFWTLLTTKPRLGLRTINRLLDHGARVRVMQTSRFADPDE